MHWILQENIFNEAGYTELISVLDKFSLSYSIIKPVPFTSDFIPDLKPTNPVIAMGGTVIIRISKAHNWSPGVYTNSNFNYQIQYMHWGSRLFNSDSLVCRLSEVSIKEEMFFLRPIHDSKSFTGKLYTREEFNTWFNYALGIYTEGAWAAVTPDTLVQVCKPKPIYAEYRLWVINSKVVTASLYKRGDRVHYSDIVDSSILDYANSCIAIWEPAKAYCLDIFVGEDGPKIGEVNCINSAGFYKANIQNIVIALEELESK